MIYSYNARKSYAMFTLVYLAGIAAPICQFKVPPMLHHLMAQLDISLGQSGWLMSIFAVTGLVMALPAGLLLKKLGNRRLILAGLMLLFAGSMMGGLAVSAPVMLASRVLEGAGTCIFSIGAPAAIAAWFPHGKRGIPIGIWVTWVPMGTLVVYILAPLMGGSGLWRHVWYFSTVYIVIVFILFLLFFRMPPASGAPSTDGLCGGVRYRALFNVCLLAAIFMLFNIVTISLKTYLPYYLELMRGFSPVSASGMVNIMIVVSMAAAPLTGMISDKTGIRKGMLVSGAVLTCMAVPFLYGHDGAFVAAALGVLGLACGNIATMAFSCPAVIMGQQKAGFGLSIVAFGQYLGMSTGPVLFGLSAKSFGWDVSGMLLLPVGLLALLLALMIRTGAD